MFLAAQVAARVTQLFLTAEDPPSVPRKASPRSRWRAPFMHSSVGAKVTGGPAADEDVILDVKKSNLEAMCNECFWKPGFVYTDHSC